MTLRQAAQISSAGSSSASSTGQAGGNLNLEEGADSINRHGVCCNVQIRPDPRACPSLTGKAAIADLNARLKVFADDNCSCVADLFQLVSYAHELLMLESDDPDKRSAGADGATASAAGPTAPSDSNPSVDRRRTVLLRVDHMRRKNEYSRLIGDWADGLGLAGQLVFHHHSRPAGKPLILIHLTGPSPSIREYLRLHRTSTVDVDSAGRKCKEKMMDVLFDTDDHGGRAGAQAAGAAPAADAPVEESAKARCCDAHTSSPAPMTGFRIEDGTLSRAALIEYLVVAGGIDPPTVDALRL